MGRRKKSSSKSHSESESSYTQPRTADDILSTSLCEENTILSKWQIEHILKNSHVFTEVYADNSVGCTILHQVCKEGNAKLLCELLTLNPPAKCMEVKDLESNFTPLHDALYYGNINCAVKLVQHGASMETKDYDGFTPLDLAIWSQFKNGFVPRNSNYNVMTWGTNSNYNLGHNHDRSLKIPEKIKSFNRDKFKASIVNVNFGKYHTLFLDSIGEVYSCGFGKGGRLGLGDEQTYLEPQKIPGLKNIVKISCSNDHSLALNTEGVVYSWGINTHRVLGHNEHKNLLRPQIIKAISSLAGVVVTVKAAKYHSVLVAKDHIYTCGFNGGQIGFPETAELYQIPPRCVSRLRHNVKNIAHVHASAAATVIGFEDGTIFVLNQYEIRKVGGVSVSVNPNVSSVNNQIVKTKKIRVTGGSLARQVSDNTSRPTKELLITILDTNGLVHCCSPGLFKQTLVYNWNVYSNKFIVSDISLGSGCLMLLTTDGEVFSCDPYPTLKTEKEIRRDHSLKTWSSVRNEKKKDSAHVQMLRPTKLVKQAGLHNGMKVVCNSTGLLRSCIVQDRGSTIDYVPVLEESTFSHDISALFDNDDVVESNLTVYCESGKQFSAHNAIIANASDKLYDLLQKSIVKEVTYIEIPGKDNNVQSMLQAIYLCQDSPQFPQFKGAQHNGHKYPLLFGGFVDPLKCTRIERNKIIDISDVVLVSNDGVKFRCHKCVLAARVEYFKIQFTVNAYWGQKKLNEEILVDASQRILSDFIYYIYTDQFPKTYSFDSLKLLLKVADQYLMNRLKSFCETKLASYITEENLIHVLCTANYYNAYQIRDVCLHIIAMNIPHYLENRSLEHLEEELLGHLDNVYKEIVLFHMNLPDHDFYAVSNYLNAVQDLYDPNSSLLEIEEVKEKVAIPGLPDELEFHYVSDEENDKPEVHTSHLLSETFPNEGEHRPSSSEVIIQPPNNDIQNGIAEININKKISSDQEFMTAGKKKRNRKPKPVKLSLSEMNAPNLPTEPSTLSPKAPTERKAPQKGEVTPPKQGRAAAWGSANTTSVHSNNKSQLSLAQIMEQEEKQHTNKRRTQSLTSPTKPPEPSHPPDAAVTSPTKTISFSWGSGNTASSGPVPKTWGNTASSPPVTNLLDIMNEDVQNSSKQKQQIIQPKSLARQTSETYDFNPGRQIHSLKEIMKAEQVTKEKSINTVQYNRPLNVIQIEEMAIRELEAFYKVQDSADEFIVIRTVPKLELGNPIWGRHLVK